MLTIPDQKLSVKDIKEQIDEEEHCNASRLFEEGYRSEELPSELAKQADKERLIVMF